MKHFFYTDITCGIFLSLATADISDECGDWVLIWWKVLPWRDYSCNKQSVSGIKFLVQC